jgi:hypothetical protein
MKSFFPFAAVLGASFVAGIPSDPIAAHVAKLQKRQGGFGQGGFGPMLGGLFGGKYKLKILQLLKVVIVTLGGKVNDPPGAAPRKIDLPARVEVNGAKAVKIRYGPYKVPNMNVKNFLGEEGALWNYPDPRVDKPCDQCTIVGMNAGLEYPDGKNANIDTGLWLHHVSQAQPCQAHS